MKNVMLVMLGLIILFSAFSLSLPNYGLSYEVTVRNILYNVNSYTTSISNIFGFSSFINKVFGINTFEEINLTANSSLRLFLWDNYYFVEVVDIQEIDPDTNQVMTKVLASNYPEFYYFTHSSDGKFYYIYDVFERCVLTLSNTDFVISNIYLYDDFQTFLTSSSYDFADRIIEIMDEHLLSYAGGR